jgi:hypothetical protein
MSKGSSVREIMGVIGRSHGVTGKRSQGLLCVGSFLRDQ